MSEFDDAQYFMRRLAIVRQAQGLTASMQFDLARDDISDDELEQIAASFGAEPSSGWGFAKVFHDMLSRQPNRVGTSDIKKVQEGLIKQGYVSPDQEATGVWDPSWYGALQRADRDAYDSMRSGHDWASAPLAAGVRVLTNTLPSNVWQGIVGSAKGFVQQTPETVSRVGALGGAIGGAAIGTAIAPGVGTLVGGAIGAGVGFFGDLLTNEEDEDGAITGGDFLDALTPFEEYTGTGGAKAFFEDLGWVGTAASLAGGARLAITGVQGIMAGARGALGQVGAPLAGAPGEMAITSGGPATLAQVLISKGPQTNGVFNRILSAALRKPLPGTSAALERAIGTYGPLAQASRPAVQLVNKVYTGAAAGALGARFSAGFTGPFKELGQGQTTIEKAIVDTDPLRSGIEVPLLGDLVDVSSFILWPERLFPWAPGAIQRSAVNLMGDTRLFPYTQIFAHNNPISMGALRSEIKARMSLGMDLNMRASFGVEREAMAAVERIKPGSAEYMEGLGKARADVIEAVNDGLKAGDNTMLTNVLSHSIADENGYIAFGLERFGTLDDVVRFEQATDLTGVAEDVLRTANRGFYEDGAVLRLADDAGTVRLSEYVSGPTAAKQLQRVQQSSRLKSLEKNIKDLRSRAGRTRDPQARQAFLYQANQLEKATKAIKANLTAPVKPVSKPLQRRIAPARMETATRATYEEASREFLRLRQDVSSAWKADPTSSSFLDAEMRMNMFLDDLAGKGMIPEDLVRKFRVDKPTKEVSNYLTDRAGAAARDVILDDKTMRELHSLGYKPVIGGDAFLFPAELGKQMEGWGIGDYTRRANFFETIGMSPKFREDRGLFAIREAAEKGEVSQVLEEAGMPLTPNQAMRRLHDHLDKTNKAGTTLGPFVKEEGKRVRLFKVDLRELSPDDIMGAFDGVPGMTEKVAKDFYGALKRGSALGGEAKLLHPLVTARTIGRDMRLNGLPGFSDVMRTWHVQNPNSFKPVAAAAVGFAAVEGYQSIKEGQPLAEVIRDSVFKGAIGAGAGLAARSILKKGYGYLPDILVRTNTALRYTLSLNFDAGRYSEQNLIAFTKFGLPPIFSSKPLGWLEKRYGQAARQDATQLWDKLNGTRWFQNVDDIDRRMYQRGLLGFNPREYEATQAYLLKRRGMRDEDIRSAVTQIGRYGVGRVAAERSANFIFFPFSFSKKLLTTLGDFMLQAPGRNLILHEGYRRFTESTVDDNVWQFVEDNLPLAKQLWFINNLAFGLSPGRFFLEGLDDNRTNVGKVMQILSSVFVPSGAATPLAQAAGGIGDMAVHLFSPVVVTGESISRAGGVDGLDDILTRYVPFTREIKGYFQSGALQAEALKYAMPSERGQPWFRGHRYAQIQDYYDELRVYDDELAPIATAMGYASTDGLLQSAVGLPFKAQREGIVTELKGKYPLAAKMLTEFEDRTLLDDRAIQDLADKHASGRTSEGEDAIIEVHEEIEKWKLMKAFIPQLPSDIVDMIAAEKIREYALRWVHDDRFAELWKQLFERQYGPIQRPEVL